MVAWSAAGKRYFSNSPDVTQRQSATRTARRLGVALDRRLVERQVDRVPVVVVRAAADAGAALDLDADALAHLALQRLQVGLALLDLAARELPQARRGPPRGASA